MNRIFFSAILLSSSFSFAAPEWKVDEALHQFLKTNGNVMGKILAQSEDVLIKENYKQIRDFEVLLIPPSEGFSPRFTARVLFQGIIPPVICESLVVVTGRVGSMNPQGVKDYMMETVSVNDGGCGPVKRRSYKKRDAC